MDSLLSSGEGRRESFSRSKIIKRGFKALEVVLAIGGWRIDSVDSVVDGGEVRDWASLAARLWGKRKLSYQILKSDVNIFPSYFTPNSYIPTIIPTRNNDPTTRRRSGHCWSPGDAVAPLGGARAPGLPPARPIEGKVFDGLGGSPIG